MITILFRFLFKNVLIALILLCCFPLFGQSPFWYFDFNNNFTNQSNPQQSLDNYGVEFGIDRFGNSNACAKFHSKNYLKIPNSVNKEVGYPVSLSFWFIYDSTEEYRDGILSTHFEEDNYLGVFIRSLNGKLFVSYGGSRGFTSVENRNSISSKTNIKVKTWYHIAVVIKSENEMDLYINGCKETVKRTGTWYNNIFYKDVAGRIGIVESSVKPHIPLHYLDGRIDDLYMWDRIISEEEIMQLYDDYHSKQGLVEANYSIQCNGKEVEIILDSDYSEVQWSDGQTGNTAVFSEKGEYTVSALFGCHRIEDTFVVSEWTDEPIILTDTLCEGSITILDAGEGSGYQWNTGDRIQKIEVEPEISTIYNVEYTNEQGCEVKKEFRISIDKPLNKLSEITDTLCNFNNSTLVFAKELAQYSVDQEGLIVGDMTPYIMGDSISVLGAPEGTLNSFYIRKSNNACPDDSTSLQIYVKDCFDCEYHIPNIFSPNGDNINDQFKVYSNNNYCLEGLYIKAYDRWGNKVVSDRVLNINTSKTAFSDLSKGAYTYIISGTVGKFKINKYGDLTIVK